MASGNSLVAFEATDNRPPLTNNATPDIRNGIPVLDFDLNVAESAIFSSVLPRHYDGGGITVSLCWMASTGTGGAAQWQVAIERDDPTTDLDADSFAAGVTAANANTNAVAGAPTYTEVALTNAQIDGLLKGEHFRLKVTRLVFVSGGIAGDLELISVELRET